MIKLRFLKSKTDTLYQLLEVVDLPDLNESDSLSPITFAIGKILEKYSEILPNPNITSVLVDSSITDWTVRDLESVQAELAMSGLRLLITSEIQEDVEFGANDIQYLMIDDSVKINGYLPVSTFKILGKTASLDMVEIYKSVMLENYFDSKKFVKNPINQLLNNLDESKQLIGAYDQYTLSRLMKLTSELNKTLYAILKV